MNDFIFYLKEGFFHIADWKAYDHILFVAALCVPFFLKDWKKLLILITAFTLGHSATLALSVYEKIIVPTEWVEFLIPVTIIIMALENLSRRPIASEHSAIRYGTTLVFGLIHGMGFSNYLKSMMGKGESVVNELLAFNLGLEIGQLLIVLVVLTISWIFVALLQIARRDWLLFVCGGIFGIALIMALERFPSFL